MWADEAAQIYAQATAAQWGSIMRPLMAQVALKQDTHAGCSKRLLKLRFFDVDVEALSGMSRVLYPPENHLVAQAIR